MVIPKIGKNVKYVGILLLVAVLFIIFLSPIIHSTSEQNNAVIKKMVLHVAKPLEPSKSYYAEKITLMPEVSNTTITVKDFGNDVEIVIINLEGSNLSLDSIENSIAKLGGSVRRVQKVVCKDASKT